MEENQIILTGEDGTEEIFYVMDETKLNDVTYLLVYDSMDEEDYTAYILKDLSDKEDPDAIFEFVEDDTEFDAVSQLFEAQMEQED